MRPGRSRVLPFRSRLPQLAARFDTTALRGHYVLNRSSFDLPIGWNRHTVGDWTLGSSPELPVSPLVDQLGATVGVILGEPLRLARAASDTMFRVPAASSDPRFLTRFDDWLYAHGGRFVAILVDPTERVYPDAVASLPILFDASSESVSSSPFLLPPPEGLAEDDLVDALRVFETDLWFPLGTTPLASAESVVANHTLDLSTWRQERAWPIEIPETEDLDACAERVAAILEQIIASVAHQGPFVGLTAGGDSRMVLACAREHLDSLRFFTAHFPDSSGATDVATAPEIARYLGLDHRVLDWRPAQAADVELFCFRTGCMVGERRGRVATPTWAHLGGAAPYVSTLGAGFLRGYLWRPDERPDIRLSAEDLLERYRFPPHPALARQADRWLEGLPPMSGLDALTLLFVEMRFGGWGGPLTMGFPDACTQTIYPLAHREVFQAALRLPWEGRLSGRFRDFREHVVAARWPELLRYPINRPPFRTRVAMASGRGIRIAQRTARRAFAREA